METSQYTPDQQEPTVEPARPVDEGSHQALRDCFLTLCKQYEQMGLQLKYLAESLHQAFLGEIEVAEMECPSVISRLR